MKINLPASAFVGLRQGAMRVELEESYINSKIKKTDIKHKFYTTLVNAYYDFNVAENVDMYAGAGIGLSVLKEKSPTDHESLHGFAYQGKVGLQYHLTPAFTVFTDYTHMRVNIDTKSNIDGKARFNKAAVGLAYNF